VGLVRQQETGKMQTKEEFGYITVEIGTTVCLDGHVQGNTRKVGFNGQSLGRRVIYEDDRGNRGFTETLYRTDDGRLVVHVKDWSRWQGEPSVARLVQVTPADLDSGGPFELLGAECGLCRPLTLEEALES
jgi:hypothetical protein